MGSVIISGAGGFIGSSLVKKMVDNGINVVAMSRHFSDTFPKHSLITRIQIEISDIESIEKIIPECEYDAFYHLAWSGVNGEKKTDPIVQADNVRTTMICASVAKKIKCKKFLCSGSVAEQSVNSLSQLNKINGGMMYGVAKHATHLMLESFCKSIGLNFVWMQFSNIFGPNNKTGNLVSYTLNELLSGRKALFGPALQPYDFIFIDDLLEAIFRLAFYKTNRNFYFIGSGSPRILKEYLYEIGQICKKTELIKIGAREDDGIIYTKEMFDCSSLIADIGAYVTRSFNEAIKYTVDNY